jgi:hypothetical protein
MLWLLVVSLLGQSVNGYVWTTQASSASHRIVVNGQIVEDTQNAEAKETENGKTLRSVKANCDHGNCEALVGVGGVIQSFLQRGLN